MKEKVKQKTLKRKKNEKQEEKEKLLAKRKWTEKF